jgi:hypothetical protein
LTAEKTGETIVACVGCSGDVAIREEPMDSKQRNRRVFLKNGAALATGLTVGAVRPASGQTPASGTIGREGTLSANEVYALTAFLLYKNDVIQEDEVLDAESLPKVKMPNRDGFALPPEWKHGTPRLQGYP